jgi:hypothetical protein
VAAEGLLAFFAQADFCGNEKLILQTTNAISPAHATLFGVMHIPQYPCHMQKIIFPQKNYKMFSRAIFIY